MNERRKLGRYKEVQADYIDHLLKLIDEGKERQPEIYCGKIRSNSIPTRIYRITIPI